MTYKTLWAWSWVVMEALEILIIDWKLFLLYIEILREIEAFEDVDGWEQNMTKPYFACKKGVRSNLIKNLLYLCLTPVRLNLKEKVSKSPFSLLGHF